MNHELAVDATGVTKNFGPFGPSISVSNALLDLEEVRAGASLSGEQVHLTGWSLVQAVAEAHGGSAAIIGSRVTLDLPTEPALT